jgi:serine/threonine protein kinase
MHFSKILNQGISSTVLECINTETKETFAAKVYHQNQDNLKMFFNEVDWLTMLEHPAIIQMKDYSLQNDQKIIFLEKCQCDLFDYFELNGTLSIKKIKNKMKSVLEAIRLIHQNNAAHCDIKIENIGVMENGDFKLIDFGTCSSIDGNDTNHFGSFLYYPPEILTESRDLQKCDIWSLGITLFACATGQYPFNGNDKEYLYEVVNSEPDFSFLELNEEYADFVSLLRGMLIKSPNDRYSIQNCLSDAFFCK